MDFLVLFVYVIEVILPRDLFPDFTSGAVWTGGIVCIIAVAGAALFSKNADQFKEIWKNYVKKLCKTVAWVLGIWAFLHFLTGFVPDREGAYKIAAAYGVQSVYKAASESEDVKRLASKSISVLESSLDKYLEGDTVEAPVAEEVSE